MLKVVRSMAELPFGNLMEIYAESNESRAHLCPHESLEQGMALAEQEFYAYLRQCFFTLPQSLYFLWNVDDRAVSAVRCETYQDGFVWTALETTPGLRGKGYGTALLAAVLQYLEKGKVYVHIHRRNCASIKVHLRCGFKKVKSGARMLDGSYSTEYDTYLWNL